MIETEARQQGTVICRPLGELNGSTAFLFRRLVKALRPSELVIDLSRVTFVDAMGLEVLITTARTVHLEGSTVRVEKMNPRIRRRLELVGVDRLVTSVTSALPRTAP
jgi:anti-anti-sigma factor